MNMFGLAPCTALGVAELIRHSGRSFSPPKFQAASQWIFTWRLSFTGIETVGKNAVVCGRSKNVGLPIALLLHSDSTGKLTIAEISLQNLTCFLFHWISGEVQGLNLTTSICHRFTPLEQLTNLTRAADVIVSAAGRLPPIYVELERSYWWVGMAGVPGLIKADMVKEGACVIDVGITRTSDRKAVGDVDFEGKTKVPS